MMENWAKEEFNYINLGDERLNQRLIQLSERFAGSPETPINQACQNWAETKAAYRFFQNESVVYKDILEAHIESTKKRCGDYSTILAIQDISYFNYSHHPKTKGLCLLGKVQLKDKPKDKWFDSNGLAMHSTLAVTMDGLPLGLIDQKIYRRKRSSKERTKQLTKIPIEEKHNYCWIEALKNTYSNFTSKKLKVITVCDREGDFYEFFAAASKLKSNIIVRANFNRFVNNKSHSIKYTGERLWGLMKKEKSKGTIKIKVPEQRYRPSRVAKCKVKATKFRLNRPEHLKDRDSDMPSLNLYAINVSENSYHEEKIDWILVTNIPVITFEDALEKIKLYCLRWRIEVFHKILKSGLKVEDCRLSTGDRLIRYLSLMSIVAWRIFWITLISRVAPNTSSLIFLNNIEWKILYRKINPKSKLPNSPPDIYTSVRWIAQLGGFLARKGDKDPGIIYVWRGLKKFSNILEGVEIAGLFMGNS